MKELRDRVAVVTGAGSGIGAALVAACAAEGMRVVAADVEAGAVAEVAQAVRADGADVEVATTDVRDAGALEALAARTWDRFGGCHLLCNNAGVMVNRPVAELAPEDWRWITDVNLGGVANGLGAFLPRMIAQGGEAHVLNTASVAGLAAFGAMGLGAYAATKFAVVGLSEHLRGELELAGIPIGVTVLCPGAVPTRIAESERNRPAELATGLPLKAEGADPTSPELGAVAPERVAAIALDAVRNNEAYAITHPDMRALVETRATALLGAFDAAAARSEQESSG